MKEIFQGLYRLFHMMLDNHEIQDEYNIITKYYKCRKESFLLEIFRY